MCAEAANAARIPLAKMAVEETRMGVVEDKVLLLSHRKRIERQLSIREYLCPWQSITCTSVTQPQVIKNHFASEFIYNKYKHTKTCGVIEEDVAGGIQKVAEPVGVIAG